MQVEALIKNHPGDHCLICGAAPAIVGIFKPDEPGAWGGENGKTRLIRYCLCSKCQGRPETPEKVERIIRAELAAEGDSHAN